MIRILCYGDSNTWGFNPAKPFTRFPNDVGWPTVLRARLGDGFEVIEEGQNGRTTVWDDPFGDHKNGKLYRRVEATRVEDIQGHPTVVEAVAADLAKTEGVDELTETHWKLVNYLREYYLEYNMAPMIRKLCKQTNLSLKEVYDLFPSGPAKGACKVAGLPKPTGCV